MSEKSAIANLITEDDTPVYLASGKQQRLLVSSIYSSPPRQTFVAAANVGIFHTASQLAIVPIAFRPSDS
ncbi:MAG: hypothetical protein EBE86_012270 [Hormoscilla sp. GUM202]|nr:hypothetical protein [Hormoscilla sp. GUM202]